MTCLERLCSSLKVSDQIMETMAKVISEHEHFTPVLIGTGTFLTIIPGFYV